MKNRPAVLYMEGTVESRDGAGRCLGVTQCDPIPWMREAGFPAEVGVAGYIAGKQISNLGCPTSHCRVGFQIQMCVCVVKLKRWDKRNRQY